MILWSVGAQTTNQMYLWSIKLSNPNLVPVEIIFNFFRRYLVATPALEVVHIKDKISFFSHNQMRI